MLPLFAQTPDPLLQAPDPGPRAIVSMSPQGVQKAALACGLLFGALYFLTTGKRDRSVQRMLLGAALAFAVCFVL